MLKYIVRYHRYDIVRVLVETDDLKVATKVYKDQGVGKKWKTQHFHTQITLIDNETGKELKEKYL